MLTRRVPEVMFGLLRDRFGVRFSVTNGSVNGLMIAMLIVIGSCTPGLDSPPASPPVTPEPAAAGGSPGGGAARGGTGPSMSAGGAVGQAGSGGAVGSAGTGGVASASDADASGTTDGAGSQPGPDPAPDARIAPGPDGTPPAPATDFSCNLVLGIKQTGEWFTAGFEAIVDNARWEVVPVHNGHIELWADANNGIWAQKPQSPCAPAATPDRVIFVGTNYDYTTVEEFLPKYLAVIENIKAKFAGVKRIELQTHIRAPGNVACPGALDFKTTIKPAQDQSLEMAVAKYPGLVSASPRFEVGSCADYGLYPHFKGGGAAAVAKKIGEHYKTH